MLKNVQLVLATVLVMVFVGAAIVLLTPEPEPEPESQSQSTVDVNVNVNVTNPTEVATITPTIRPTVTIGSTKVPIDFCDAIYSTPGDICRMVAETVTPTATLPACWSSKSTPGQLCQIREE